MIGSAGGTSADGEGDPHSMVGGCSASQESVRAGRADPIRDLLLDSGARAAIIAV
ncbi:MAG: hypothetical protein JOZ41_03460 [Chloroflexi bacterium]|nr:hypothetical protein [Chloroflexota bacterium]